MRNFDIYQDDTTAAAYFISKYCKCDACPIYEECDLSPTHEDTKECFNRWKEFLGRCHYTFWDEDDFADVLQDMIDCEKCPLKKENKCNPFDFSERCKDVFLKWLNEDREICVMPEDHEAVQKTLERSSNNTEDHSNHYLLMDSLEVADIINKILSLTDLTPLQGFYLGNVIRYIMQADGVRDYKNASEYLNRLIGSLEG